MTDEGPVGEARASAPATPKASATPGAPAATGAPGDPGGFERASDRAGREPGELQVALSPRQIIGGFALLAGLIVWLARRGRRKS